MKPRHWRGGLDVCKLTLEVLEGNAAARALYQAHDYAGYALDPAMGQAMFWQKKLQRCRKQKPSRLANVWYLRNAKL